MKSAVRVVTWAVSITFPLVTSLIAHLVFQTVILTAEVRGITSQLGRVEDQFRDADRELRDQRERVTRLEAATGRKP